MTCQVDTACGTQLRRARIYSSLPSPLVQKLVVAFRYPEVRARSAPGLRVRNSRTFVEGGPGRPTQESYEVANAICRCYLCLFVLIEVTNAIYAATLACIDIEDDPCAGPRGRARECGSEGSHLLYYYLLFVLL